MLARLPFKKIMLWLIVIVFVVSLIPVLFISQYDHPSVDDFSYGGETYQAFRATGSPFQAIRAALGTAATFYREWQGTFSATFLMALQPAVWGEDCYFLTTLMLVISLTFSTLFFSYILIVRLFGSDKTTGLIIGLVISGISIQFVPSPVEAFFWYNGSIYYTFFYSLSLILFGLIIRYIIHAPDKKGALIRNLLIVLPLAFFISGGNYVTALVSILILSILVIYLLVKKRGKAVLPASALLVMLIGLSISAVAPGNAVRQARLTMMPPFQAVMKSFVYGANFIGDVFSNLPVVIGIAFIAPFLFLVIKNTRFRFHYPALILILSYCVFSAQFTPTLYAMSSAGDPRVQNIRFFACLWFISINLCYFFGWLYQKLEHIHAGEPRIGAFHGYLIKIKYKYSKPVLLLLTMLFFLSFATVNYRNITCVSALRSLTNGEAAQYDMEQDLRLAALLSDEPTVELSPLSVTPYVLYFTDIGNPPDWRNDAVAQYYGKAGVTLK